MELPYPIAVKSCDTKNKKIIIFGKGEVLGYEMGRYIMKLDKNDKKVAPEVVYDSWSFKSFLEEHPSYTVEEIEPEDKDILDL